LNGSELGLCQLQLLVDGREDDADVVLRVLIRIGIGAVSQDPDSIEDGVRTLLRKPLEGVPLAFTHISRRLPSPAVF